MSSDGSPTVRTLPSSPSPFFPFNFFTEILSGGGGGYFSVNRPLTCIKDCQEACSFLIHMHEGIVGSLKKSEDKAIVSVRQLERTADQMSERLQKLESEVRYEENEAREWREAGRDLAPYTFGLSLLVAMPFEYVCEKDADEARVKAQAQAENLEITHEASRITRHVLLPAIKETFKTRHEFLLIYFSCVHFVLRADLKAVKYLKNTFCMRSP